MWPHNALYFNAFLDLNTTRAMGFGAGPLPWLAIHEYCIANDFDQDQHDAAHILLRAMDTTYLTLVDKKERQKAQADKARQKAERNKRGQNG